MNRQINRKEQIALECIFKKLDLLLERFLGSMGNGRIIPQMTEQLASKLEEKNQSPALIHTTYQHN